MKRLACIVAMIMAGGCAKTAPLRVRLNDDVERPPRSVVILFADGMDHRRFHQLLDEGRLPNIKRRFVDGGVGVEYAVTSIPALTYPSMVSFLTGRFPGHHDITGNQWFDRRTLQTPNYITAEQYTDVGRHFDCPTLYELLPDYFSVNCLGTVRRGIHHNVDCHIAEGLGWFLGLYTRVDELSAGCVEDVALLANRVKCWPSILFCYFPGVDQTGHELGSDSAAYADAMHGVDVQIGRITDAVEKAVSGNTASFVLVSDHGHIPAHAARTAHPIHWLRSQLNLKLHEGTVAGGDLRARLETLNRFDAHVVDGSSRRIALHLRGSRGWFYAPRDAEVDRLFAPGKDGRRIVDLPGIALVCRPDEHGRVLVQSAHGRAMVERRREQALDRWHVCQGQAGVVYRLVNEEGDPLGYLSKPELRSFIESGWYGSRQWLEATADQLFPDFVPQIVEYFDSPRAGNVLILADQGWVFAGHGHGEHGSATCEDMRIPLYFAGGGLPKGGSIRYGRLVDVLPTIMDLLGESGRLSAQPPLDGVSLLPEIRRSSQAVTSNVGR